MAAPCQRNPSDALGKMKLSVVLVALAIALTFQVRNARSKSTKNTVSIHLQTDGADAIFWQFIRPFFHGQKPGFLTVATGSSNGTTSSGGSSSSGGTNQSAQGLNNSNAIFATNSNVSANISQVFNQPSSGDENADGQDSNSASTATTTEATTTTETTTESTTTTETTTESTTTTEASG